MLAKPPMCPHGSRKRIIVECQFLPLEICIVIFEFGHEATDIRRRHAAIL